MNNKNFTKNKTERIVISIFVFLLVYLFFIFQVSLVSCFRLMIFIFRFYYFCCCCNQSRKVVMIKLELKTKFVFQIMHASTNSQKVNPKQSKMKCLEVGIISLKLQEFINNTAIEKKKQRKNTKMFRSQRHNCNNILLSPSKRASFSSSSSSSKALMSELIRANTKSEFFERLRNLNKQVDQSDLTTSSSFRSAKQQTAPLTSLSKRYASEIQKQNRHTEQQLAAVVSPKKHERNPKEQQSIIMVPPQIPWAFMKNSEEFISLSFNNHQYQEEFLLSLQLPKSQRFRAFIGKDGFGVGVRNDKVGNFHSSASKKMISFNTDSSTASTKIRSQIDDSPPLFRLDVLADRSSYLYQRIAKPLEPLFEEFPDLVLEGNIARLDGHVQEENMKRSCYNDLVNFSSTSSERTTNRPTSFGVNNTNSDNNKTKTSGNRNHEVQALFSGTQFYTHDISHWGSVIPLHLLRFETSFEIRSHLLYKLLKFCVDPKYLHVIGSPAERFEENTNIHQNKQINNNNKEENSFTSLLEQYRSASTENIHKPICFLGNIKSSDRVEDVFLAECERFNDSIMSGNTSSFVEGVVIRMNESENGGANRSFIHVPREETEFKVVEFVASAAAERNENRKDNDDTSKVESIKCLTESGVEFEAPLIGVSDEIRRKLWSSRRSFLPTESVRSSSHDNSTQRTSRIISSSSSCFALVEYSGIEKGIPIDALVKKIIKKKKSS